MEMQVVVLAGGQGSKMYPLAESSVPKALLPIANRPMVSFQLEMLEQCGFKAKDIIVILNQSASAEVAKYLAIGHPGHIKEPQLVVTPDDEPSGAALERAAPLINRDFIVVPCDAVIDPSVLHPMADVHRINDASMTCLLKPLPQSAQSKQNWASQDFIGLHEVPGQPTRLVTMRPATLVNDHLSIRKAVLRQYPSVTVYTGLLDAHFYIFSHWVLRVLPDLKEPKTVKGSLVQHLLKCQLSKKHAPEEAFRSFQAEAASMSCSRVSRTDLLSCLAYVLDSESDSTYCRRANTSFSYLQVNLEVASGKSSYKPLEPLQKKAFVDSTANVSKETAVGPGCIVGAGTVVGARSSIKHSVVGRNCTIGDRVKLSNCIVQDNVVIEDESVISYSIVCGHSRIGAGCTVEKSTIGFHYMMESDSHVKDDLLVVVE